METPSTPPHQVKLNMDDLSIIIHPLKQEIDKLEKTIEQLSYSISRDANCLEKLRKLERYLNTISTETRITMMFLQGSINQRKRKLLNLKGKVSSKKNVLKAITRDIIRAEDKLLNNDCLFRPSKRRRLNETIKPIVRGSTIGIDWDRSNSKTAKTINFSDSIEETVSDEE